MAEKKRIRIIVLFEKMTGDFSVMLCGYHPEILLDPHDHPIDARSFTVILQIGVKDTKPAPWTAYRPGMQRT